MKRRAVENHPQEFPETVNGGHEDSRSISQAPSPISKRNREKPHKQEAGPHQDLEFDCEYDNLPLIPQGKYEVIFLSAEKRPLWGGQKVFLHFQIVTPGEFHGEKLYMACNAPPKRNNGKKPESNKYLQAWELAAGRKPDRIDRASTKVFRGKVFLANVRTVIKNSKNLPRPPASQYSIIENLLERRTDSEKE